MLQAHICHTCRNIALGLLPILAPSWDTIDRPLRKSWSASVAGSEASAPIAGIHGKTSILFIGNIALSHKKLSGQINFDVWSGA